MPRMNAIGVPLLKLGPEISLTQDRWVDLDPSTFTPELIAEFENLRMRGLIGIHPDDNDGIPVGKAERATLPKPTIPAREPGVTWTQPKATPPKAEDDRDDDDPSAAPTRTAADTTETRDETPSKRRR